MQRRRPSNDELDRIIRLRHSGASWLQIQRETAIPRRTIKLVYEGWERQQSLRELLQVRRDVAADEFREHINNLTRFATAFLDNLSVRSAPGEMNDANAVLDRFWRIDIPGEIEPGRPYGVIKEKNEHRIVLRNQMLFKSLNDHTRGAVRWETLDKWKDGWDWCVITLVQLRKQGLELLDNFFKQEPSLKEKVNMGTGAADALELMLGGLLWAIWQAVRAGKYKEGFPLFQASERPGFVEVTTSEGTSALRLKFSEKAPAEKAAAVCNKAAQILCKGDTVSSLVQELAIIQRSINELEEMLDSLVLRPLILKTRCDLCPV